MYNTNVSEKNIEYIRSRVVYILKHEWSNIVVEDVLYSQSILFLYKICP